MFFIRQGATHKVTIGPAVAVGDGFTPVTTLSLSTADEAEVILHDNGTVVDISGYTFAAITTADGYYHLTLQSGISNTVGHMTVVINDDSLILPLRADFTVLEEAIYDSLLASSAAGFDANQRVNVGRWLGAAVTLSSNNKPDVNVDEWADVLLATTNPLPNAAADGAGGLPISDAGGLDLDALNTSVGNIESDTSTDGVVLSSATQDAIAAAILDLANGVETGETVRQFFRLARSVLLGKASGMSGTTAVFRDRADTKDRVTATVDEFGNRTAVTTDAT